MEQNEMAMYKYVQLTDARAITGVFCSSVLETDRTDIMHIPDDDPLLDTVSIGWRLGEDGQWYPPAEPTEAETLQSEITGISAQLQRIYQREQYAAWLGVEPDSETAQQLIPEPAEPLPVQEPPPTLRAAFAQLTGETPTAAATQVRALRATVPKAQLTKNELLANLSEKTARLAELKG
jgi:hypothetical protein